MLANDQQCVQPQTSVYVHRVHHLKLANLWSVRIKEKCTTAGNQFHPATTVIHAVVTTVRLLAHLWLVHQQLDIPVPQTVGWIVCPDQIRNRNVHRTQWRGTKLIVWTSKVEHCNYQRNNFFIVRGISFARSVALKNGPTVLYSSSPAALLI